jgi:hypothetical protein
MPVVVVLYHYKYAVCSMQYLLHATTARSNSVTTRPHSTGRQYPVSTVAGWLISDAARPFVSLASIQNKKVKFLLFLRTTSQEDHNTGIIIDKTSCDKNFSWL